MFWFTADQHFGHRNVIKYCNRPFSSIEEMDAELIIRHNSVVEKEDTVVHCGDFTLIHSFEKSQFYVKQLNGNHIFLRGSHDRWLENQPNIHERWERRFNNIYIVADHYAGRTWPRSHYGSWQIHGHSHGNLKPIGLQHDIGVDNNNYYPVSLEQLKEIFKGLGWQG